MGVGQFCAMPMLSCPVARPLLAVLKVTLASGFRNDAENRCGMQNLPMPMDNALSRTFLKFCAISGATE
jgi:hypothetical protein